MFTCDGASVPSEHPPRASKTLSQLERSHVAFARQPRLMKPSTQTSYIAHAKHAEEDPTDEDLMIHAWNSDIIEVCTTPNERR